jgi:glycosyltransferase involved in cell wall biosynthesis
MTTDVVVCAHNEASTIIGVLAAIRAAPGVGQIVVVADACSDATATLAHEYAEVVVIAAADKGTAMARGLERVESSLVLFCDADLTGLLPGHVVALLGADPQGGQVVGLIAPKGPAAVLPPLSGERRLPADLARSAGLDGSGWRAETLLNVAVAKARVGWHHLILRGVTNPTRPRNWPGELAHVGAATLDYGPELIGYMAHPDPR